MRLALILTICLLVGAVVYFAVIRRSHPRSLPPMTPAEVSLASELRKDVEALASIGPRTTFIPGSLPRAAAHVERSFKDAGYDVQKQKF